MSGQIFIYIISLILVSLILVYGYNAIRSFGKRAEQVNFLKFKTELESFSRKQLRHGDVKISSFSLPKQYTEICFVDSYHGLDSTDKGNVCLCNGGAAGCSGKDRLIACDAWKDSDKSNVFLTPMAETPIDIGPITVDGDGNGVEDVKGPGGCMDVDCFYFCESLTDSKIRLRLEGKGNHVLIGKAS